MLCSFILHEDICEVTTLYVPIAIFRMSLQNIYKEVDDLIPDSIPCLI